MEDKMTHYEAQMLPKQKVTRKLIEEIYSSPPPPARPNPVKLKPSRCVRLHSFWARITAAKRGSLAICTEFSASLLMWFMQKLRLTFAFNYSLAFLFTSENKNFVFWGMQFHLKFVNGFPIVLTSPADELCSWILFMAIECCFAKLAWG